MQIIKAAVIGNPINHSLSPDLFKIWGDFYKVNLSYEKILCLDLEKFFTDQYQKYNLINITTPFKQDIINLITANLEKTVIKYKSSNCLCLINNEYYLYNDDYRALLNIYKNKIKPNNNIFIFGGGGIAKTIYGVLQELKCQKINLLVRDVNKYKKIWSAQIKSNKQLKIMDIKNFNKKQIDCLINATSIGIDKKNKNWPYKLVLNNKKIYCYDVIYGFSPFYKYFSKQSENIENGIRMFVLQASYAFARMTKITPNIEKTIKEIQKLI